MGPSRGARLGVRHADPDGDRARRSRRRHLDDTESIVRMVVDVEAEAAPLDVELLRPVDVRDREHDELQLELHVGAAPRPFPQDDQYASRRRNQGPASLRPMGARSSHWYMPHIASRPRAYAE